MPTSSLDDPPRRIDLNADVGEGAGADEAVMPFLSRANIACGGHVGDRNSMARALELARIHGVAAGAHPSYPDTKGFGRRRVKLQFDELVQTLIEQIGSLLDVAAKSGIPIRHVKAHGALYNDAVDDQAIALAIARAAVATLPDGILIGPPLGFPPSVAERAGLAYIREGFADRRYDRTGRLVPRGDDGVHVNVDDCVDQAIGLAIDGRVTTREGEIVKMNVDTICIHGDHPSAGLIARRIHQREIG